MADWSYAVCSDLQGGSDSQLREGREDVEMETKVQPQRQYEIQPQ